MSVDIVERGRLAGHVLALEVKGPWPEHDDPHAKYWVTCSCGHRSTVRRTEKGAAEAAAGHLRSVTRRTAS